VFPVVDVFPVAVFPVLPANPSTIPFTIILGIFELTIEFRIKTKLQKKDSYLLISYKKKG
jgi:hypothetical protein